MNCSDVVKIIEKTSDREVERAKALLLVNYGIDGKRINGVVNTHDNLEQSVLKVCQEYERLLALSMKAERDGYIYDPPSWKVCPVCGGSERVWTPKVSGEGSMLHGDTYTVVERCSKCNKGYIPIYYTPEQWEKSGGVLTDDTLVWYFEGITSTWFVSRYNYAKSYNRNIIATSAGRPEEK